MTAVSLLPSGSLTTGDFQVMPPLPAPIFADLKADIEERGVRYPIIVTQDLVIVDGHHRYQIAQELGITADVPVCVVSFDSHEAAEAEAIALNIDRRPFTREERDRHILRMRELLGMTQQEVADRFGLSRQRIDQIEGRDSSRQETSSEESDPLETAKAKTAAGRGKGRGAYRFTPPESAAVQSEIERLAAVGLKQCEIADEIGISFSAVSARLRRDDEPESTPLHEQIAECASQGMTSPQIAQAVDRTVQWVRDEARKHDITIQADKFSTRKNIDWAAAYATAVAQIGEAVDATQTLPPIDIEADQAAEWSRSLDASAKSIRTLIRQLNRPKKEQDQS